MWAIGFSIILALYITLIVVIAKFIQHRFGKRCFRIISILIPVLYPFSYFFTPSYHNFINKCNADDRLTIYQTKEVHHLYLGSYAPYQASCNTAFVILYKNNFQSIDCEKVIKYAKKGEKAKRGVFRFIRNDNWTSDSCGEICLSERPTRMDYCGNQCVDGILISQPSNYYNSKSYREVIVKNKLIAWTGELYDAELGLMAKEINYTYYPYGNGWAKILGLSSASAPTRKCSNKVRINHLDIYLPKK